MGGLILRIAAAVICVIAAVWLALWYFIPAPPHEITIAAGVEGSATEHIAARYSERLARHHVKVNVRLTKGSLDTVRLLRDQNSGVDTGFALGGVSNGTESPELVSLGRVANSPIWIFYRSPEPMNGLSQLKGKRVSMSPASRRTDAGILAAYGANEQNTAFQTLNAPTASKALLNGEVDAIFISQEVSTPNVQALLRDPAVRLMNVAQAEALTQLFPSLNQLTLAQGVIDLEKNIPPNDVNLIALPLVFLARGNLHPEMIYLLAQTMKEEHGRGGIFRRAGEFPTQTDPEFPMAEEAVDYYRNGPSFLQRYLPFWMINYAKRVAAILVTAIAVIIPLFTYGPKLYDWLLQTQLKRLYRRLRVVEDRMLGDLTAPQVAALQGDVDSISRAARILPLRHSDLFFPLIMHIDLVRARLASRSMAAHGERAA
ncbi:MAG TPA: TAXI family TRAP transporter solute-binding subunit [Pseudolabrys sp.]|nr:TAXI family TRAP transporter solute-binding subunit [Pseudolabrys sp.]